MKTVSPTHSYRISSVKNFVCLFRFIRKEDQIKKDEQFARALQEQYDHAGCTQPETSKTRDVGDHQVSEHDSRGEEAGERGA